MAAARVFLAIVLCCGCGGGGAGDDDDDSGDGGTAADAPVSDGDVGLDECDASGSPWQMTELFDGVGPFAATDANGTIHVVFADNGYYYSSRTDGTWSAPADFELLDRRIVDLAVGAGGDMHALTRGASNTSFAYGVRPGNVGSWSFEPPIDDTDGLAFPDLSVDPAGQPVIVWTGDSVSFWAPPSGSVEEVDGTAYDSRGRASLGATNTGSPEACYTGNGAVYCARRNGPDDWSVSPVASSAPGGNADAVIATRGDRSHLVFRALDVDPHDLKWGEKATNETLWPGFETIASATSYDIFNYQVHVASDNTVHVVLSWTSTENEPTYALYHLEHRPGQPWQRTAIVCGEPAAYAFSSVLDGDDELLVFTHWVDESFQGHVVQYAR